jgi:4-hydroxy-tetrahydrodipicolinate reductase
VPGAGFDRAIAHGSRHAELSMRLALVGNGRMSRAIAQLAAEQGHEVHTVITAEENRHGVALTAERLAGTDVVFEFTRPEAAVENLLALARLGLRVVSGTTGWHDRLPAVAGVVIGHGGALLHSPNFSPGVQLFLRAAAALARQFAGRPGFDGFVVEAHHAAKRDAPSGTGLALRAALRRQDPERSFPVSSIRGGHLPGTHAVLYDAPFETVRLEHTARGRQVFAAGALSAGQWLQGRTGVFTFDQMLFGEGP